MPVVPCDGENVPDNRRLQGQQDVLLLVDDDRSHDGGRRAFRERSKTTESIELQKGASQSNERRRGYLREAAQRLFSRVHITGS